MEVETVKSMEGYLEIRSKKLLQMNRKYWFVLNQERMDYFANKDSVEQNLQPLGSILMKDIIDVKVTPDKRNMFVLARRGEKENLILKAKKGNNHNWVGNIRAFMFRAREETKNSNNNLMDDRTPRIIKRSLTRTGSFTKRPGGGVLVSQLARSNKRFSCSTNDLSQMLPVPLGLFPGDKQGNSELSVPLAPIHRPRGDSTSALSLLSGSSWSSSGRNRKKPRIPVSGFTSRAYLANEREMMDEIEINTKEDLEYIVQAERKYDSTNTDDEHDGPSNGQNDYHTPRDEETEEGFVMLTKNVHFKSKDDISLIDVEVKGSKHNRKSRSKDKNKDKSNEEPSINESQKRLFSSMPSWMTLSMRRKKKKNADQNIKSLHDVIADSMNNNNREVDILEKQIETIPDKQPPTEVRRQSSLPSESVEPISEQRQSRFMSESFTAGRPYPSIIVQEPSQRRKRGISESSDHAFDSPDRTSMGSLSVDIIQKLSSWKDQSLSWSPRKGAPVSKQEISSPLELDMRREADFHAEMNCQIDQIAQDRLEAVYQVASASKARREREVSRVEEDIPPPPPKKPLKFHIKQLERLLDGKIAPQTLTAEKSEEVMLMLGSLKVLQNMDTVSEGRQIPEAEEEDEPLYDIPIILEDNTRPLNLVDVHYKKKFIGDSISDIESSTSNRSWENSVSQLSISSSQVSVSSSA